MPFIGFSLVGSLLGTLIIAVATVHALSESPDPLMVPGGNHAVVKWAGPDTLKQPRAAN
ncbi:MAG: hypothetical protein R3D44_02630 [Hyphomicrobiaceae bacterium]